MTKQQILQQVDHTILKPEATWMQVQAVCDEALWGGVASVCLSPCHVAEAAKYLGAHLPICTVIGFPHGTSEWRVKAFEAECARASGATELDLVLSLGLVKEGRWSAVLDELRSLRTAADGAILKVIVETCLLTQEEKRRLCALVSEAGADYIKTSTGFSSGGATLADVRLFRAELATSVKIKAAGGIRSFESAQAFLEAGADRIGSSALVALAKAEAASKSPL